MGFGSDDLARRLRIARRSKKEGDFQG